jgi:tryptophanyl-tRNA synthetase
MSRVLTGDRPTGPLHLGHYFGTLSNRVSMQRSGHDVFIVVADYQVLTDRDSPGELGRAVRELVRDYLASGLDPDATVIFPHSCVPELNELLVPFLSLVSVGELSRNPTVKDEIRLSGRSLVSGLMFSYPVHQAADILFCKGELVPVGRDQLPHLELTRTIARRFAERYGPVFPLPDAVLSDVPLLPGLDGRKMSKSLGNGIALSDGPDVVAQRIRRARTDSDPFITFDPERRPGIAALLRLAALCSGRSPEDVAAQIGSRGAAALKALTTDAVCEFLRPLQMRRAEVDDAAVTDVLCRGIARARDIAVHTLDEVHAAIGIDQPRVRLAVSQ